MLALHSMRSVSCIKGEDKGHNYALTSGHDFVIFTTILSISFNQGNIHESFHCFDREKLKMEVYRCFGNDHGQDSL